MTKTTHNCYYDQLAFFFDKWPTGVCQEKNNINDHFTFKSSDLNLFFQQLNSAINTSSQAALSFNPWEVSGLKHNEVRNSAVLSWLLTPNGSHGFGKTPLLTLLNLLGNSPQYDFPNDFKQFCHVHNEVNPNGNISNRADIQIRADNFFLLIEVKINAKEQDRQISRYCEEAEKAAHGLPWAIIYLTLDGRMPTSNCDKYSDAHILCLSWKSLSISLSTTLQPYYQQLFTEKPHSPMRQFAALSTFLFIEQMQNF